jgi:pilus assembly protein CpaE
MLAPEPDPTSATASPISKISVALIAPDDGQRRAIAKAVASVQARIAGEFAEYPSGNVISKLIDGGCNLIIVDLDAGVERALDLIEAICRKDVSVTVMACSAKNAADVIIRAMRAGAREFLASPITATSISEAFSRATARHVSLVAERSTGRLLVFQSAKGGAGSTTLATNFSVALAKKNVGPVVLVDLHPQLGEVALGLGIAPQFSVADALANVGRLDADFLATMLIRHESGLMVLASADAYGTHRSLERGAEKLFRILREEYAFVVVDTGSCSGNIPDILFETANIVYLVVEGNLPALRNARRLISYFTARENAPALEVVLNRYNSRTVEIDEESTLKALSRPVDWKIPNDYLSVRGAQNLGVPLVAADTAIARAISQMANAACRSLAGLTDQTAPAATKGDKWKFWTSNATRPLSTARS